MNRLPAANTSILVLVSFAAGADFPNFTSVEVQSVFVMVLLPLLQNDSPAALGKAKPPVMLQPDMSPLGIGCTSPAVNVPVVSVPLIMALKS